MYKNSYEKHEGYPYKPYTYLVTHKETGKRYYGSRTAGCAHPDFFFKDYFTSSKYVQELINTEGLEAFDFEIRKVFDDADSCLKWEKRVLTFLKVHKNDQYFNIDTSLKISKNKDTILISNPCSGECIRIKKSSLIPSGWIKGNINNKGDPNVNHRKWYHDPHTLKPYHLPPDHELITNLIPGRGPGYVSNSETLKAMKLHHITDGINSILISKDEPIPEGWYKGRTFKNKPSGKRKDNWVWVTDGEFTCQVKDTDKIIEGWKYGRTFPHKSPPNKFKPSLPPD